MYKRILVPLDGSPLAETVLSHVQMLTDCRETEIVLLQIIVDPLYDLVFSGPKLAMATRAQAPIQQAMCQQYLTRIAAVLEKQGIRVMTLVREGVVAETILACADECRADLIVLATHGVNTPHNWQLGNVAYRVIHDAPVPVLLVRTRPTAFQDAESVFVAVLTN